MPQVPKRLMDALDRKDVQFFLRYWAALPVAGRVEHPQSFFVWAALSELGEQLMSNDQWIASSKRVSDMVRNALAVTHAR